MPPHRRENRLSKESPQIPRSDHFESQLPGVVHIMQDRNDVDGVRTGDVEDRAPACRPRSSDTPLESRPVHGSGQAHQPLRATSNIASIRLSLCRASLFAHRCDPLVGSSQPSKYAVVRKLTSPQMHIAQFIHEE